MNTQRIRQAHIDWTQQQGFNVFATLKFKNGYDIGEQQAERVLRIFLNRLDRTYFGKKAIREGSRVRRFVYMHKGRSGQNIHYHVLFEAIGDIASFCRLAHHLWSTSFTETDGENTQVTRQRSILGSSVYALHEYGNLGEQTFREKLSHSAGNIGVQRNMRHLRRLLKATDGT